MRQIFYVLFSICFFVSCTKVIDVKLNTADTRLVIEGLVSNATIATVTISQSVSFNNKNTFPPISGATVTIRDNTTANNYLFTETVQGIYTNALLKGTVGHSYTLTAVVTGKTYTGESTMPAFVPLDTLLTENLLFGNKTIIVIKPQYNDPAGFGNNYHFIETINRNLNPSVFVWNDDLNDGGISTRPLIQTDSTIAIGDSVEIEMRCIDKNVYRYINAIADLNDNSTTPANPPGNISGNVLGYFSVYQTQKKTIKIR